MSVFIPRFAYAPVRCAVAPTIVRHEVSPLWSLFDDAQRQLQQIERYTRQVQHQQHCQQQRVKIFNPRFDLKEDKESYVLEGEVPGFQDSDLSIEWNDNVLAIRGKHESVVESGKKPEQQAVETEQTADKALEQQQESATAASESDSGSVKSHQATVEDEPEEPANASAVSVAESSKTAASAAAEPAPAKTEAPAQQQQQQPEAQQWISERRSGQFLRQFRFPSNAVNHADIKASLQSGILKIVVPKAAVPESRTISIE